MFEVKHFLMFMAHVSEPKLYTRAVFS